MAGCSHWPGGTVDPADLRQRSGGHVGGEVRRVVRRDGVGDELRAQRGRRLVVGLEVGERVEEGEAGGVVVDLPGHAGLQQLLGHGGPVERAVVLRPLVGLGDEHRAAGVAGGVDGPRERHDAVGVGGAEHRAVVGVTDREGVGQRVIERQVAALEIPHGGDEVVDAVGGDVRGDEGVHLSAVPARVLGPPRVIDVIGGVAVVGGRVLQQMEGHQPSVRLLADDGCVAELLPDRAGGTVDRVVHDVGVGEAPDARQRPEVMVERAVLLHEDDDVTDIAQCGIGADGIDRQGPFDARTRRRGESQAGCARTDGEAPLKRVRRLTRWAWRSGRRPRASVRRSSLLMCALALRSPPGSLGLTHSFPAFQMRNRGGAMSRRVRLQFNERSVNG